MPRHPQAAALQLLWQFVADDGVLLISEPGTPWVSLYMYICYYICYYICIFVYCIFDTNTASKLNFPVKLRHQTLHLEVPMLPTEGHKYMYCPLLGRLVGSTRGGCLG